MADTEARRCAMTTARMPLLCVGLIFFSLAAGLVALSVRPPDWSTDDPSASPSPAPAIPVGVATLTPDPLLVAVATDAAAIRRWVREPAQTPIPTREPYVAPP